MGSVKPDYGYAVERTGPDVTYKVSATGFGCGVLAAILFASLILGGIGCMVAQSFVPLGAAVALGIGLHFLINARRKRPQVVTVTPEKLVVDRDGKPKDYERAHISNLVLENTVAKAGGREVAVHPGGGTVFVGGTGVAGVMVAGGAVARNAVRQTTQALGDAAAEAAHADMAQRAWAIKARYGSSYVTIFKGLKQGVAEALFEDFCKAMA